MVSYFAQDEEVKYIRKILEKLMNVIILFLHIYKAGIPLSILRSFDFEVQASLYEAKINCSTEAANLTACSISLSPTSKLKAQQAGIRCFQTGIYKSSTQNTHKPPILFLKI